jgi:hypothetical protein
MDITVIEQYTQPIPKLTALAARSLSDQVDHTRSLQQLSQLVEQQDRKLRRLESELAELRSWLARNSK